MLDHYSYIKTKIIHIDKLTIITKKYIISDASKMAADQTVYNV